MNKPETEEESIRAEALRRLLVRRRFAEPQAPTKALFPSRKPMPEQEE